jgi:hypothetical protein
MMRISWWLLLLLLFTLFVSCEQTIPTILNETTVEETFLKIPNAARLFEGLAFYTSSPHIAGE